jgi:glycosyltransferase involved in cell wall biosynthesis
MKERMHLVHFISSLERGGAQTVLYNLVQKLATRGYKQSVIYLHEGPFVEQFQLAGIPVYKIKGAVVPFDVIAIMHLYRLLKKLKPDCVHTVLWAANWLGRIVTKLLHIPCIASLHNNYDQNGWMRNILDRLVPFSNNVIIAVSDEVKKSFYSYQHAQCSIAVIHNGIDCALLQKQHSTISRTSLNFLSEHFVIGSVGRFHSIKRYCLLLDAFAQLYMNFPNARLLLIGAGPQEQELRKKAHLLGIDSVVTWIIDKPAYPYYALMDCFMLTSAKEGISMALLEAMSAGVACLVTNASLAHSVLEHMRNGIVATTDNATLLSEKMALLMTNVSLRKKLAQCAQHTVKERFDAHNMIGAYDELFRLHMHQK